MPTVQLHVNGVQRAVDAWDAEMPLLYALRNELGLHAAKFGCGLGQCGSCTVLLDDAPVRSCTVKVGEADGRRVVTAEGLGTPERPHPVQAAFIAEQALQCGYCTNGMIMQAAALIAAKPAPTEADVCSMLNANLCRCGCQPRVVRAVLRAAAGKEA